MNEELREKIVRLALLQHNKKYVHGKNGPETFDCAGLVWHIYKKVLDINVYEDGIGKSTTGKIMTSPIGKLFSYDEKDKNKDLSFLKPGDVLLFHRQSARDTEPTKDNKYPGHCGIYIGDRKFINATILKGIVIVNDLEDIIDYSKLKPKKWVRKLVGFKRYIN